MAGEFFAFSQRRGKERRQSRFFLMSSVPTRLLFLRPDTYGDLFLFEPVLRLAREALPNTKIGVLIREPYLDVIPLIGVEGVRWLTTSCEPYREGPRESRAALQRLRISVQAFAPDCVVAACYNRTWLEAAVASFAPNARQISLGEHGFDPLTRASLSTQFDVDWDALYPEKIIVEGESFEWEKNLRLADGLKLRLGGSQAPLPSELDPARTMAQIATNLRLEYSSIPNGGNGNRPRQTSQKPGREIPRWWPMIHVPDDARERASNIFSEVGINSDAVAVCCPAGTANVKIKAWPAERYGQTLAWLERERGIRCLLIGHESEKETLETVQRVARSDGADPSLWWGRTGEMPIVAGLVERAQFYLGNDTGTLHLAAALGRPTVSIFGGGHWPRFKPLARRSAVVVQPLPCFGCAWNCLFGYGPCVKEIPRRAVISALEWLLAADANGETETVVEDAIPIAGRRLIAQTVAAHNENRTPESPLEQSIQHSELVALLHKLDVSEADRAARLKVIERQGGQIDQLQAEVERWLTEAAELGPKLNSAESARHLLAGELEAIFTAPWLTEIGEAAEAARAQLSAELEDLRGHFTTSEADRAERLEVIERQSEEIVRLQAGVDRWLTEAKELWLKLGEAEAARNRLAGELEEVRGRFAASEADRVARLEVIERQGEEINRLRKEVDNSLTEGKELWAQLDLAEVLRDRLAGELEELRGHFAASEADRAARLEVIEQQGTELNWLRKEVDRWLNEAKGLWSRVGVTEAARDHLAAELKELRRHFTASEADRAARLEVIEQQGTELNWLRKEVDHWLNEAKELWSRVGVTEGARDHLAAELTELRGHHAGSEADRAARLDVIERQGAQNTRLQAEVDHWLKEAGVLWPKLNAAKAANASLSAQLADTQDRLRESETHRTAHLGVIERQNNEIDHLRTDIEWYARQLVQLQDRQKQLEQRGMVRLLKKLKLWLG